MTKSNQENQTQPIIDVNYINSLLFGMVHFIKNIDNKSSITLSNLYSDFFNAILIAKENNFLEELEQENVSFLSSKIKLN